MKAKYYIAILSALVFSSLPLKAQFAGNGFETSARHQIRFVKEPDRSQEMRILPASLRQIQPLDVKRSASDLSGIPESWYKTRSAGAQPGSSEINSAPDRSYERAVTLVRPSEMSIAPARNASTTERKNIPVPDERSGSKQQKKISKALF